MRRQQQTSRRSVNFDSPPWENYGGKDGWPLVLLIDRGVTLVGSKGSAWADVESGNGYAITQDDDLFQPTWVSGGTIGRVPSFHFSGGQVMVSGAMPSMAQTTWYVVYKLSSTDQYKRVFSGIASGHLQEFAGYNAGYPYSIAGTVLNANVASDLNQHIVCAGFGGANSYVGIGTSFATGNAGTQDLTGVAVGGLYALLTHYMTGDVAAVLLANKLHDRAANMCVLQWLSSWSGVAL